jgi:glycosyltransferase involved in cell wall biosynthesis
MKQRLLFVVTNLGTGGILRSLQNFLNRYDATKYSVDVFALVHQGVYQGELKNCTVLPPNRIIDASLARYEYQHGLAKLGSLAAKLVNKGTKYRFQQSLFKSVANDLVRKKHYDAVIAFSEGVPTSFVAWMDHPNKIGWIHCDYASYYGLNHGKNERVLYDAMKSIVCVSNYTRSSFLGFFPDMANKTYSIYNIIDDGMMKDLSKQPVGEQFDKTSFNLVSVGRIDPVKRLSAIPQITRKIVDTGRKIRWYVIGPKGTDEEYTKLLYNIDYYCVSDFVVLLGEKRNPYPYIAHADLLVNTSISEACPYVINEAKILGTPVVCTDFGSAKEFLDLGINGYYVPIEQMADTIVLLMDNESKLVSLKKNLSGFEYNNDSILQQIYSLI